MTSVGGVVGGFCVCVCVLECVFVRRRVSMERGRRESFDSHCYCLVMMQSTTRRHLEAAPRADGHSTYLDVQALDQSLQQSSERQNTEEEEGRLH